MTTEMESLVAALKDQTQAITELANAVAYLASTLVEDGEESASTFLDGMPCQ